MCSCAHPVVSCTPVVTFCAQLLVRYTPLVATLMSPRCPYLTPQRSAERHRQRTEGDIRSAVTPEKWKRMVAALNRNGFFEEEIEGSQRYREKMAIAEVTASAYLMVEGTKDGVCFPWQEATESDTGSSRVWVGE